MGCDRMLFDGRHKLMWGDPGSDQRAMGRLHLDRPVNVAPSPGRLYDLADDPHELQDLASETGRQGLLLEMLGKLVERTIENAQMQPFRSRGTYCPPLPGAG
jgi:hypothetical protein